LSLGQGNLWLNGSQGVYAVWKTIYYNFTLYPQGVDKNRILGAEACLWGEVSNEDTLENNLWMRSSAFASRVWTEKMLPLNEIVASLVNLQKILEYMGVDPSPVTSEFC
jgi:hexosaminidase